MLVNEIEINEKIYIHPDSTVSDAIELMNEYKIIDAPVVLDNEILGHIKLEDIIAMDSFERLTDKMISYNGFVVKENDHLINSLLVIVKSGFSVIAVVNDDGKLKGCITDRKVWNYLGKQLQFGERGSIIVVEVHKDKYLISDVIRILESEGSLPIMFFAESDVRKGTIQLTLKLQTFENQVILNALERHGIQLLYTFEVADFKEFLSDRYDQLIKYLDI